MTGMQASHFPLHFRQVKVPSLSYSVLGPSSKGRRQYIHSFRSILLMIEKRCSDRGYKRQKKVLAVILVRPTPLITFTFEIYFSSRFHDLITTSIPFLISIIFLWLGQDCGHLGTSQSTICISSSLLNLAIASFPSSILSHSARTGLRPSKLRLFISIYLSQHCGHLGTSLPSLLQCAGQDCAI